jgi:small subunit ribosomal protein S1
MIKEDGSEIEADERIDFKIIEFNADGRRVVASHTELHKKLKAEKVKVEKTKTAKALNVSNSNVERSTLGDLDALSKLKEQMEGDEKGDN